MVRAGFQNIKANRHLVRPGQDVYKRQIYSKSVHSEIRVKKTKWVILRYPNSAMAQLSEMSTRAFEDYYFNVCNLDYGKMDKAMDALKVLMEKTDRVRLVSPGTDIAVSYTQLDVYKRQAQDWPERFCTLRNARPTNGTQ